MKWLIVLFFPPMLLSAQDASKKFNRAIEKEKFNKVERIFKHKMKQRKKGTQYDNGPGSGMQTTHAYNLDTLVLWLQKHSNVEDALWDKCANKISIYPGWVIVGAKFKTKNDTKEMCFHIQEGTTGNIRFFGLRIRLFPHRNILRYKKMYGQAGFIEQQRKFCLEN